MGQLIDLAKINFAPGGADPALIADITAAVQYQRGSSEPIDKDELADTIDGLNSPATLEPFAVTVKVDANTTVNVAANDRMKIRGSDNKNYTLKEWNDLFVAAGFDKDAMTVQPVGLDVDAFDIHECYMFDRYQGVTYQPAGVNAGVAGRLAHSIYNNPLITAAGSGTDFTTGKTWQVQEYGNTLILSEYNTGKGWQISLNCGYTNQHRAFNAAERTQALWTINEWMRHRMAIDSELATTEEDGTYGEIGIFDANGDIAAVGVDMYFWIKEGGVWTNTGKLAKYNVNNLHGTNSANLTQAIADAIYASQIAKGVNMNDTGVNSDTIPVLAPGSKGAECIAVNGYWYIITPFISNPDANVATANKNMADSPAVYWAESQGCSLPSDSLLQALWINKSMADGIINYLNSREGRSIPALPTGEYTWTAMRASATSCWIVTVYNGYVNGTYTYSRSFTVGASAF